MVPALPFWRWVQAAFLRCVDGERQKQIERSTDPVAREKSATEKHDRQIGEGSRQSERSPCAASKLTLQLSKVSPCFLAHP
jgi:hypothetical protein